MSNNKHRKPLWRAMQLAGIASVTWSQSPSSKVVELYQAVALDVLLHR
jgi:hypothetical protein